MIVELIVRPGIESEIRGLQDHLARDPTFPCRRAEEIL